MRFEVTDEERRLLTAEGVVVAWFDDPAMAVRVARLLNADETSRRPDEFQSAHELLADFPQRLREHRWRLNLSLTDVGIASGIAHRNIAAIERGEQHPALPTALALLDWMARSVNDSPRPGESRAHASARATYARARRIEKEERGQVQAP